MREGSPSLKTLLMLAIY